MNTVIKAVVRDGRLEVHGALNLPEGTVLEIPVPNGVDNPNDAESASELEDVLAAMDRMTPLHMTDDELSAWEAERQIRKDREKANFFAHAETLQRMWP